MKRLLLFCSLLLALCSTLRADVTYHGTTGQTLYVRIQTGASTFKGVAMTEGSSGGLGVYKTTDAALVSAGITTASATAGYPNGYPFTIRSGSASDTANDTILGGGSLSWSGSVEIANPSNVTYWSGTANASPDTAGYPKVTIKDGTGTGEVNTNGGYVFSDLTKILGTTLAESSAGNLANNLKTFLDNDDNLTAARLDHITNIKTKTDYLPSATAGASGGVFIAGTNAQTTVTSGFGADTITATSIAANAIGASEIATDAIGETEIADSSINAATFVAGAIDSSAMNVTGTEFTSIPWNASWDAEVQSEADDALVANHLDHLLAAAYDPTSKPGNASALLNVLVENDGGVPRFTINALEQGPSGGGGGSSADDIWSFDLTTATGIADPDTAAYKLVNAEDIADFIDDIATAAGGVVSAFLVDEDHSWGFQSRSQTTSPQLITEIRGTGGFNGLVAMDFTVPMPANASISSVGTVGVADETGKTEPTLSAASLSPDKKKVHVPVNATAATAGTYTISVTITTTDSQTFMRKGRLVLE